MIVLMAGLPGSGKSTLARELAWRTSGRVLSKDDFRHALFAPEEIEYSTRQDDFCLELMLQTAGYLLTRDPARIIFLDGRPFSRRRSRMWLLQRLLCTSPGIFSNASAPTNPFAGAWRQTRVEANILPEIATMRSIPK
jgi:hypothetical protein